MAVVARDDLRRIVVFPDQETLEGLRQRIRRYRNSDGDELKAISAIEAIRPLTREDRTGRRLEANPVDDDWAYLDLELWSTGVSRLATEIFDSIASQFDGRLRITDRYISSSIGIARIHVAGNAVGELLDIDWVKELDRPPQTAFEFRSVVEVALSDVGDVPEPNDEATGILVVDSGVMRGHPLLAPAIGDTQVFLSDVSTDEEDGDEERGHGTAVSGVAVYGDLADAVLTGRYVPRARLFSARVTTSGSEYDPEMLCESQLRRAVDYFVGAYPDVHVVNISLGDKSIPYRDGTYQFRLAAVVDELAYEYRDQGLLFVVSTGNYDPNLDAGEMRDLYPEYLLDPEARIIDPATAALALTVGGVSHGGGRAYVPDDVGDWLVAATPGWPSPFTRTGLGLAGMQKPDVVETAGDLRFNRAGLMRAARQAGVVVTSREFGPPEGRLLRTDSGTSFAAPKVANHAARLFEAFPGHSANLVRALIASSASVSADRPAPLDTLASSHESVLRIYGHGQPNVEQALQSADNRVLLLVDSSMPVDNFRLFSLPVIPDEFFTRAGAGRISVTLAYDPPTRATRTSDYMGVRMQFLMFRNVDAATVSDAIRSWDPDEVEELEEAQTPGLRDIRGRVELKPAARYRNRGTLQKGSTAIRSAAWQYDRGPVILAVVCLRRWAALDYGDQPFAVAVTVSHDDENADLYTELAGRARPFIRQRVRLQG